MRSRLFGRAALPAVLLPPIWLLPASLLALPAVLLLPVPLHAYWRDY